jgi:5-dehydro-4-deoxyglucarate dehydratase
MPMRPEELKSSLSGLLAFALTPFDINGAVDTEALRIHVELLLESGCAAIFPAGGTGEFFSLTLEEYRRIVSVCVDQVAGRIPVVAGAGSGTSVARKFAQTAERAGADGVLILPPYLVDGPPEGLVDHYVGVAQATKLGVIIYQRGSTVFEPVTVQKIAAAQNVIGFKDGVGQIERLLRIKNLLGDRLVYLNGMPTAEIYAEAFATCGVSTYSSAILTFMPEIATAFHSALDKGATADIVELLSSAILPFAEIRNRVAGYAVSLVKRGAQLRGVPVGSVRPPLADPRPQDETDLFGLLGDLKLDSPLTSARLLKS